MMKPCLVADPETVPSILESLGTAVELAEALGVTPSAISEMKRRNSIPVPHWGRLLEIAPTRHVNLNYEVLVKANARRARSTEERAS